MALVRISSGSRGRAASCTATRSFLLQRSEHNPLNTESCLSFPPSTIPVTLDKLYFCLSLCKSRNREVSAEITISSISLFCWNTSRVYTISSFLLNLTYCLGTELPLLVPFPPAGITAYTGYLKIKFHLITL
jgi:hypothetical protein